MELFQLIAMFVLLAGVIVVAGTFLAGFADALGDRIGLGRTMAGMLLLAMATSLPELAVDCSAAWMGKVDLAVGDLLGSCLFNLLILAALDLFYRTGGQILSKGAAAHALAAVACIVLTTVTVIFILVSDDDKVRWAIPRVGPGTVAIVVTYLVCTRMIFFDQKFHLDKANVEGIGQDEPPILQVSLPKALIGYLVTTAIIFAVAPFLAKTADDLAVQTGLGGTFVGTVFVALTTSLPEIITTRAAVRMGAFDLAIGNIFGSNSFNILIMFAVDLFYDGDLLADVQPIHAVTGAAVILSTAVATLGLLYRAERRFWKIEYDAALLVALISLAFGAVYFLE